ncbi:hypothetical protein KC345_g10033 [Hortaea werneckii]|nr:hypothetical protein KC345_g10033 [Hortaea werneckii]
MAKKKTKPRRFVRHTPGPLRLDALRTLFDLSPQAQYLERMKRLQGEPLVAIDTGKYIAIDTSLWKGENPPSELYNGDESDTASMLQQKMVHHKSSLARLHTPKSTERQPTFGGTQAFQPAPSVDQFPLMDLPPELRKMVLQFSLQDGNTIGIRSLKSSPKSRKPRYPIRFQSKTPAYFGLRWNSVANRWTRIPSSNIPSLMRISKQMREESAPIIYGDHVFHFRWMDDCHLFLRCIGKEMRFYLRRLYIDDFRRADAKQAFQLLTDARHLQSLEFGPRAVLQHVGLVYLTGDEMVLTRIAEAARPLLQAMQAKFTADLQQYRTTDPLFLIRFHKRATCENCAKGMERRECMQSLEGFLEGMRNTCEDEAIQVRLIELGVRVSVRCIMRESFMEVGC